MISSSDAGHTVLSLPPALGLATIRSCDAVACGKSGSGVCKYFSRGVCIHHQLTECGLQGCLV